MAQVFRSRDVQKLLGITRTQVLHWAKSCLAVPPASPPRGTGRHQKFSARNVIDLAIVRELIDHGLTHRRIRDILALCRYEPYHDKDQEAAITKYVARFNLPAESRPPVSYDHLVLYREPPARGTRLVGRATGAGIRWWKESHPKRFLHTFVDKRRLAGLVETVPSLTAINVRKLRELVYAGIA